MPFRSTTGGGKQIGILVSLFATQKFCEHVVEDRWAGSVTC